MCFTHSVSENHEFSNYLETEILAECTPLRYLYTELFYPLVPRIARIKKGVGRRRVIYVNQTARRLAERDLINEARDCAVQVLGEHLAVKLQQWNRSSN